MTNNNLRTAWESCRMCSASGLENGLNGPVNCSNCKGDTTIRIRDKKGRFATRELKQ